MYLPLEVAKNYMLPKEPSKNQFVRALQNIVNNRLSDEALWTLYTDEDFMSPDYNGVFKELNDVFLKYSGSILKDFLGIDKHEITDISTLEALLRDVTIPHLTITEWAKCKQIYRFDSEMEHALMDTEEVSISPTILRRLPYRCFYVEFPPDSIFSGSGNLEDNHGFFVKCGETASGDFEIIFTRFRNDLKYFTGQLLLDHRAQPDVPLEEKEFIINKELDCPAENIASADWKQFAMFSLNAILYLCAMNNEISECPETVKTYHPGATVKNKFSEICKWDVGVRFGAAVRRARVYPRSDKSSEDLSCKRKHASPRPYMRRAHWHHYRVGKGRTELILKWIEPVFVGSGEVSAVKHRVRNEPEGQ